MLPLHIMVSERNAVHVAKKAGSTLPTKRELRKDSMNKWQSEWVQNTGTGGWTRRLIPDVRPWVSRSFGTINYHITQFLTGHGCFEHAFFECDRWWRLRRELEVKTGKEFTPETAVKTMLESREKWDAVCCYVVNVLKIREEEERQRQRVPANN
ncbi:uncharacterized protein LOC126847653 [Adelges cooleyi]|uniref:uncharacterized protein LOC126847653 n=1 Tax=Adelges cooleyi TaxID=133065 RepID=UPI00217FFCD0|nr:uncharacterized protein LOC126847653 [Adelges cooleyi]